jgi:hypothetical protein
MTSAFASGTQRKAPRLLPLMLGELGIPSMNLTDRAGGTLTEIARSCNVMTVIFKQ